MSETSGSTARVVNEPLRLLLSPQEIAYIEERIGRAKRQLCAGLLLPAIYVLLVLAWTTFVEGSGDFYRFVTATMLLSCFIVFGVTLHLLLAGSIDWVMFARYRRDHRAFLNRYNRS